MEMRVAARGIPTAWLRSFVARPRLKETVITPPTAVRNASGSSQSLPTHHDLSFEGLSPEDGRHNLMTQRL